MCMTIFKAIFSRKRKKAARKEAEDLIVAAQQQAAAQAKRKYTKDLVKPQLESSHEDLPDMPRRQPCPKCGGWRRRARKTLAGAWYLCSRCDRGFFVAH